MLLDCPQTPFQLGVDDALARPGHYRGDLVRGPHSVRAWIHVDPNRARQAASPSLPVSLFSPDLPRGGGNTFGHYAKTSVARCEDRSHHGDTQAFGLSQRSAPGVPGDPGGRPEAIVVARQRVAEPRGLDQLRNSAPTTRATSIRPLTCGFKHPVDNRGVETIPCFQPQG